MERGFGIRSGGAKSGWEDTDFPIVCQDCLGTNPFVRMLRKTFASECKLCNRPFTIFRWKAGGQGRFKRTEICQTCAKLKNLCQTCVLDLKYGLPVELRDKYMGSKAIHLPEYDKNREWWAQRANEQIEDLALPYDKFEHPVLRQLQAEDPKYSRNQAHICTLYQNGQCTLGPLCPNLKKNQGQEDERVFPPNSEPSDAPSLLVKATASERLKEKGDPIAAKIVKRLESQKTTITVEDDESDQELKTIYLVDPPQKKNSLLNDPKKLREFFGDFGDVVRVHKTPKEGWFIEFESREGAEALMRETFGVLNVMDEKLTIRWSRSGNIRLNNKGEFEVGIINEAGGKLPLELASDKVPGPRLPPPESLEKKENKNKILLKLMGIKQKYKSMEEPKDGALLGSVKQH